MDKDKLERTLNLRISESVYEKLQRLAEGQFRSMNSTAMLAILEKYERDMEKK
jgi:hypothetical protein